MPPTVPPGATRLGTAVISGSAQRRLEHQYMLGQPLLINQHQAHTNVIKSPQRALETESFSTCSPSANESYHESRTLPNRAVTDETLAEAYTSFIMFCNPGIPSETDTTELKKIFRLPPKSDGKNFSTFTLYELIRRFEQKELKTWAQLALELGVEPPMLDKGQSAQKVQQYAVRLKRWMHAMHVDAFFEYLLGKEHVYWTQVPSVNDPTSEAGRDGVPAEEDLALRALLPETRPKRGRRKVEDKYESDLVKSPSQRPRLESPTLSEDFVMVRNSLNVDGSTQGTAHPDLQQGFNNRLVPWSAISSTPGAFRWPPDSANSSVPIYPQSAITPTNRTHLWQDEPQSAAASKIRSRRRHGPVVSSAWPNNGSTSSGKVGKLRGRPPSNRAVTDGPFSTFPANPGSKEVPMINLRDEITIAIPTTASAATPQCFPAAAGTLIGSASQTGRPSRLQLQVPQRQGGVVRLATPPSLTPPPLLLVNGQSGSEINREMTIGQLNVETDEYLNSPRNQNPDLEPAVIITFRQNENTNRTNIDTLESHFICEILRADWFNENGEAAQKCSIGEADKICKQVVKNLRADSSSTDIFLVNLSALAGGPLTTRLKMTRLEQGQISQYQCHRKMVFGSIEGNFTVRVTVNHGIESKDTQPVPEDSEQNWKRRFLDLQQQIKDCDQKVRS